jgi:N-acetylmuramoyl-L-alanine amidase
MRDRRPHQIFAERRSPSWVRIGLTLAGAVAIVLAGVGAAAWVAGAFAAPATPSQVVASKHAMPARRAVTARARTVAAAKAPTPPAPPAPPAPVVPATPSVKPKSLAKPASARVRRHVSASTLAARHPASSVAATRRFVVVIDPGHQGQGDNHPEPIGPGASQTKPAVADGAEGVVTHRRESVDNLEISLKLRQQLRARGVTVIMVRTSENVDIPNSERAKIANRARADLFVRVHCDGVSDQSVVGLLTVVPERNQWTGPIVSSSARAGRDIQSATLATTHAHDRGISPRADMSGFNWSRVPSVIVETGVMSNPAEDRRLADGAYQDKLAAGIADGIMRFSSGR